MDDKEAIALLQQMRDPITFGGVLRPDLEEAIDLAISRLASQPSADDARDAARYRWLRANDSPIRLDSIRIVSGRILGGFHALLGEQADAAIDAALSTRPSERKDDC